MSQRLTLEGALGIHADARLRAGCSPATVKLEQRLFRAALARIDKPVARITRQDLLAHLAVRSGQIRATSLERVANALKAVFGVLREAGRIATDPSKDLQTKPGTRRPPLLLTEAQVARLLTASLTEPRSSRSAQVRRAVALRNRACLELLYGTGLRAAEVAATLVTDLDLADGSLLARRVKRGKSRRLPLPPASLPPLEAYRREGRPHLVSEDRDGGHLLLSERGNPLDGNAVFGIVSHVAKRAGLRAHPHALRRSLASQLVCRGVSLRAVQELLGHARLDTTARYVVLNREELRRAVDVLDRSRSPGAPADTRSHWTT